MSARWAARSIILITEFIDLDVNCSDALVLVDYGVACASWLTSIGVDDLWRRSESLEQATEGKGGSVCDDPKRPCPREAIYTFYSAILLRDYVIVLLLLLLLFQFLLSIIGLEGVSRSLLFFVCWTVPRSRYRYRELFARLKLAQISIDHQVVGKSRKRVNTTGTTYLVNISRFKLIIHFRLCSSQIADTSVVHHRPCLGQWSITNIRCVMWSSR